MRRLSQMAGLVEGRAGGDLANLGVRGGGVVGLARHGSSVRHVSRQWPKMYQNGANVTISQKFLRALRAR